MAQHAQGPENTRFNLQEVGVVVVAQYHNPSILNPDFLVSHAIVPEEWQVAETHTTPLASVVKYENGVSWLVDQSRMTVVERCETAFEDNYRIHRPVTAYLKALPFVPYRSLGLNFKVTMHRPNPQRWLIERFAASWLKAEPIVLGMIPRFVLRAGGNAVCNISVVGTPQNNGQINSDCNFHHEGPLDTNGLCMAIDRWPERQAFVVSALTKLLGT